MRCDGDRSLDLLFSGVLVGQKDVFSMKKHRKIFLGLGLAALFGLSAPGARAETMTLSVFLNGSSTPLYTISGTAQGVSAEVSALNANLATAGTGYSFSSLAGASDFPGSTGATGGYVSDAGNLTLAPGTTGGTLTIVVTEGGFTAPSSGTTNTLTGAATSIFSGAATASTQTFNGNFVDNSSVNVTTPTTTQSSTGALSNVHGTSTSASVPVYVLPYTLTNTTTISLATAGSSSNANDVFTGKTSIVAATVVPEPASLVMMVTGMPLPLVVMGLLRRRRAAAA
jgi:hypothetical protein